MTIQRTDMENPAYLGDGLYAYFDGNGVELRLARHDNKCAVYLEPEVMQSLDLFYRVAVPRGVIHDDQGDHRRAAKKLTQSRKAQTAASA